MQNNKKTKILIIFLLIFINLIAYNKSLPQVDKKIDDVLFMPLLFSDQWKILDIENWDVKKEFSTDNLTDKNNTLLRFRTSSEKNGLSIDYCLNAKSDLARYDFSIFIISPNEDCQDPKNEIFVWNSLVRIIIKFVFVENEAHLEFQFIDGKNSTNKTLRFPIPNLESNSEKISWFNPLKNLLSTRRLMFTHFPSFLELNAGNFKLLKSTNMEAWKKAIPCHQVDDQCMDLRPNECHFCDEGVFEVFDSKCNRTGTKFCGRIECGGKNSPACYLGREHIQQEDFKGCHLYSEEYYCQSNYNLVCEDGKIPWCN